MISPRIIDSAMVANLGANASAAIGLVSTSTWLMSGVGSAICAGFSVQVAQYIGAGQSYDARRVIKHGLITSLITALLLLGLGVTILGPMPCWLGGDPVLWKDASAYFLAVRGHKVLSSEKEMAGWVKKQCGYTQKLSLADTRTAFAQ